MEVNTSNLQQQMMWLPRPETCTERLLAIMRLLYYYTEGVLGGVVMPEAYRPGLDPAARENYHYLTLPMALNYRRSSYQMWKAALRTFTDPKTAFVFAPEQVVTSSEENLRYALRKYGLALLPKQHVKIWRAISEGIVRHYDGDIRNLFCKHNYEIPLILREIQGEQKRAFPYLSGYKIANYWLYVMWQYAEPPLRGKRRLSVAPDTHIIKSSVALGLVSPSVLQNNPAQRVAEAWEDLFSLRTLGECQEDLVVKWQALVGEGLSPIDMHYALWLWSRQGFKPAVHGTLPLDDAPVEILRSDPFWKKRRTSMSRIVLGTSNPAKKEMVKDILAPLGIEVVSPADLKVHLDINEDGTTPQENSRKKAVAYMRVIGEPVLSIDNALYIQGLPPAEQPGLYVRRIPGRGGRPSDQELLEYYLGIIRRLGGEALGHWEFAIAIACPDGAIYEKTILSARKFVSKVSNVMLEGYPLESIQIDPETGKYVSEMSHEERASFWRRTLGDEIEEIVLKVVRRNPSVKAR